MWETFKQWKTGFLALGRKENAAAQDRSAQRRKNPPAKSREN
jgi:hypothetical protein